MSHEPHPVAGTKDRQEMYACSGCSKRVQGYQRGDLQVWRHYVTPKPRPGGHP